VCVICVCVIVCVFVCVCDMYVRVHTPTCNIRALAHTLSLTLWPPVPKEPKKR
jgi:hypothetical protein